ncbi:hypothetical protein GQ53DRAFT_803488 [Thozetella sp. PMI_491]|nr:hypothetical protein GQ53DRAFT_803488 [Thozetella sp. PMI_491]
MESQLVKEYDSQGGQYGDYAAQIPFGKLETELFRAALGECTGLTVLDLGGGSGLKAREAVDAGAAAVDVVDLSVEMMRAGEEVENSLGREGPVISWHTGDITQALTHLPLRPSYDLVLVGWTFDHAHDLVEYEGVRVTDPRSATWDGRYGARTSAFEETAHGLHYRYTFLLDPPLEFEASSINLSMAGNTELPEKYGLTDFSMVAPEEMSVINEDPGFWKPFVDDPGFVVFQAKKRSDFQ